MILVATAVGIAANAAAWHPSSAAVTLVTKFSLLRHSAEKEGLQSSVPSSLLLSAH